MASTTRTQQVPFSATETVTAAVGFIAMVAIAVAGEYAEREQLYSTWYLRLLHDHGADFASVGLATFGFVMFANAFWYAAKIPFNLLISTWGPLIVASYILFAVLADEVLQKGERLAYFDRWDMVAEILGWVCTMGALGLVRLLDRLYFYHLRQILPTNAPIGPNLAYEGRPMGALSFLHKA